MTSTRREWKGVPLDRVDEWQRVFSLCEGEGRLREPCPSCGKQELHRFYLVGRRLDPPAHGGRYVARGSQWEWCANCHVYEHSSALVPATWQPALVVDEDSLTAEPEAIQQAIEAASDDFTE